MQTMLSFLLLFLDVFQVNIIALLLLGLKPGITKKKALMLSLISIGVMVCFHFINVDGLDALRNMLICVVCLFFIFDCRLIRAIIIGLAAYFSSSALGLICACAIQYFVQLTELQFNLIGCVVGAIVLLVLLIVYRVAVKKTINIEKNKLISLLVAILLFSSFFVAMYPYYRFYRGSNSKYFIFICIFCLVSVIVGISVILLANQNYDYKINEKINNEKNNILYDYFRQMESRENDIRRFKHDYNNHIRGIGFYLKEKQYEELEQYLDKINSEGSKVFQEVNVGNNFVNAILGYYINTAKQKNISVTVDGIIPENAKLDDYDWSTIISNCMSNAIEATEKTDYDNRLISIRFFTKANKLIINMINPVSDTIELNNGMIKTTKADAKNHGFGIKNIKKSLGKYNGEIVFNILEDHKFETTMWIRI